MDQQAMRRADAKECHATLLQEAEAAASAFEAAVLKVRAYGYARHIGTFKQTVMPAVDTWLTGVREDDAPML